MPHTFPSVEAKDKDTLLLSRFLSDSTVEGSTGGAGTLVTTSKNPEAARTLECPDGNSEENTYSILHFTI